MIIDRGEGTAQRPSIAAAGLSAVPHKGKEMMWASQLPYGRHTWAQPVRGGISTLTDPLNDTSAVIPRAKRKFSFNKNVARASDKITVAVGILSFLDSNLKKKKKKTYWQILPSFNRKVCFFF